MGFKKLTSIRPLPYLVAAAVIVLPFVFTAWGGKIMAGLVHSGDGPMMIGDLTPMMCVFIVGPFSLTAGAIVGWFRTKDLIDLWKALIPIVLALGFILQYQSAHEPVTGNSEAVAAALEILFWQIPTSILGAALAATAHGKQPLEAGSVSR